MGDEKFAVWVSAKYEVLKWIDVDLKMEIHTAMGDCVVFKKLGKKLKGRGRRGKGGCSLYWVNENYGESKSHHMNESYHG